MADSQFSDVMVDEKGCDSIAMVFFPCSQAWFSRELGRHPPFVVPSDGLGQLNDAIAAFEPPLQLVEDLSLCIGRFEF
ncbi:hypothetical protein WB44_01110 [Synechococcus sp. WH 8020]|nr:hypothetical protein WB44_01110 [Synechococcus sp. WH 8020]